VLNYLENALQEKGRYDTTSKVLFDGLQRLLALLLDRLAML
jgi:hypothetical protein